MKHSMPENHAQHPNVVPLIDIIMCLIIFFMLVAKIGITSGEDKKIKPPESTYGIKIADKGNTIMLNVTEQSGQPFVSALVNANAGQVEQLPLSTGNVRPLVDALKRRRYGEDLKAGGTGVNADNAEFKVILRVDQDVSYKSLKMVMFACAEANVKSYNFQTEVKD